MAKLMIQFGDLVSKEAQQAPKEAPKQAPILKIKLPKQSKEALQCVLLDMFESRE
jgi:hypothetical protein